MAKRHMCVFFSGEEPESLRGPQAEMVVIDEIGRMRYQQAVFDTMMLGLRHGDRPRVRIATTPRITPFRMTGWSSTTSRRRSSSRSVGVDPSGGGDEVGIVASVLLNDGRFAVLADRPTSDSPAQWGEAVVKCHDDFDADNVVVEINSAATWRPKW